MTLSLRLPREVHEPLVAEAKSAERSLNAQIVYVLRRWLAERNQQEDDHQGTDR